MSGLTHRVQSLPPGTTPERALADGLAELVEAVNFFAEWERAVKDDGIAPVHLGSDKTYGEMLEDALMRKKKALWDATSVLYSVGRWVNPPL